MSSSVAEPENNQTQSYNEPTTVIMSQTIMDIQKLSFVQDPFSFRQVTFHNKQLNISDYGNKEKLIANITWKVGENMNYYQLIQPDFYFKLLRLNKLNTYFSFDNEWILKFNTHQYMQGLAAVVFSPQPTTTYYEDFYGKTIERIQDIFQLPHHLKYAMDRDTITFSLPSIYPFAYYLNNNAPTKYLQNYLLNYPLGYLKIRSLVELDTTSTEKSCTFILSCKLTNVKFAGNRFGEIDI